MATIKENKQLINLIPILEQYGYNTNIINEIYPVDEDMYFDEYLVFEHKTIKNRYVLIEFEFDDTYINRFNKAIVNYGWEKINEIDNIHRVPGFETLDFKRCKINKAFISGPVGNGNSVCDEYDDSAGISLTREWQFPCYNNRHLKDANISNIERAIWIQNNHLEYAKFILDSFIKNIEVFEKCCKPILSHYDFSSYKDSLFIREDGEDSSLYIEYRHPVYEHSIYLETDMLSGKPIVHGVTAYNISFAYEKSRNKFSKSEFEKEFLKNVINADKQNKEIFAYVDSEDPNENINSYDEIWNCRYILLKERYRSVEKPNLNNIPERFMDIGQSAKYQYELEQLKKMKKKMKAIDSD